MPKLSVNINKIATLRNARGGNVPDLIRVASDCQRFGADGITVHPRPDQRHIRYDDVYKLKEVIQTEYNIEGYPTDDFLRLVTEIRPQQVTLVPDPPDALTSNAGWDTLRNKGFLRDICSRLQQEGIRVSLFVEADEKMVEHAADTGANRVELYTESYARNYEGDAAGAVRPFTLAAKKAHNIGLGLNAGHDLNLLNLSWFSKNIPNLLEVSIGHALISDALYYGLENTIQLYRRQLV